MREFHFAFQINRLTIFFVDYYTLGSNRHPYFATSAWHYVRSKMGTDRAGQRQKDVLHGKALSFFRKWDKHHLKDITEQEYEELLEDLEELKDCYNFIEVNKETFAGTNYSIPSSAVKSLSML